MSGSVGRINLLVIPLLMLYSTVTRKRKQNSEVCSGLGSDDMAMRLLASLAKAVIPCSKPSFPALL